MTLPRRSFFQFLARGTGAIVASWVAMKGISATMFREVLPARSLAPTNQKWVMVIDLAKCDGCRDCTRACSTMHFVPPMQEWVKVFEVLDNPAAGR
jgi:Na+-translocating ferredoxin:NAD+ oxidoreductase RNF subunit RnfB